MHHNDTTNTATDFSQEVTEDTASPRTVRSCFAGVIFENVEEILAILATLAMLLTIFRLPLRRNAGVFQALRIFLSAWGWRWGRWQCGNLAAGLQETEVESWEAATIPMGGSCPDTIGREISPPGPR